jgi:hypothetical protein
VRLRIIVAIGTLGPTANKRTTPTPIEAMEKVLKGKTWQSIKGRLEP